MTLMTPLWLYLYDSATKSHEHYGSYARENVSTYKRPLHQGQILLLPLLLLQHYQCRF